MVFDIVEIFKLTHIRLHESPLTTHEKAGNGMCLLTTVNLTSAPSLVMELVEVQLAKMINPSDYNLWLWKNKALQRNAKQAYVLNYHC